MNEKQRLSSRTDLFKYIVIVIKYSEMESVRSLYYLRDGPALSGAKSPSLSLAAQLRAKMLINLLTSLL